MDLNFSKEDQDFQSEVREFLDKEYPKHIKAKMDNGDDLTRDEIVEWHKVVAKKGWMGHSWPVEYGGTGWDATKRYIYLRSLHLKVVHSLSLLGYKWLPRLSTLLALKNKKINSFQGF